MTSVASVTTTYCPDEPRQAAETARDILTFIGLPPDSFQIVMCDPTTIDQAGIVPTLGGLLTAQDREDLAQLERDIHWARWDFTVSRGCDGVAELASMGPEGNHLWAMWRSVENGRLVVDCFERTAGGLKLLEVDSVTEARALVERYDPWHDPLCSESELDAAA